MAPVVLAAFADFAEESVMKGDAAGGGGRRGQVEGTGGR